MSMGVCLGLSTLWKTWLDNTDDLFTVGVFASLYYVTEFIAWYAVSSPSNTDEGLVSAIDGVYIGSTPTQMLSIRRSIMRSASRIFCPSVELGHGWLGVWA